MKYASLPILAFSLLIVPEVVAGGVFKLEEGYQSLFNGKDLTGWKYGDVPPRKKPPTEILDGKVASSDNRFEVKDGLLIANTRKGRNMAIYTAKEFNSDFIVKLEFRTSTKNKSRNRRFRAI